MEISTSTNRPNLQASPYRSKTTSASTKQEDASDNKSSRAVQELSAEEQRQLQQLKNRDREVRAHEQAHLAAGRELVRGGASFTYQKGPDGRQYAVGGEVTIDTSKKPNDPEHNLHKAGRIRDTALAPKDPSAQDRRVASHASQMALEAQQEILEIERLGKTEERAETSVNNEADAPTQATNTAQAIDYFV